MSFSCMRMKNHFEIKSFALSFALKKKFGATRKRSIVLIYLSQLVVIDEPLDLPITIVNGVEWL